MPDLLSENENEAVVFDKSTEILKINGKFGAMNSDSLVWLKTAWADERPVGLLLFGLNNFLTLVRIYGEEMGEHLIQVLTSLLKEMRRRYIETDEQVCIERIDTDSIIIVFAQGKINLNSLVDLAMTMRLSLRSALNQEMVKLTGQNLDVRSGYARIRPREGVDDAHIFYQALCDAQQIAMGSLNLVKLHLMEEFRRITEIPLLGVVYQPIVDLRSAKILGWESLARGPQKSRFHLPSVLFGFAEQIGALFSLERVCREQAISNVGPLEADQKLFLNIHPQTLADPNFTAGQTRVLLDNWGLQPANIVFEITERHPIRDFTLFFRTLEHYRSQGYLVAIDDVGSGYSGLWTLGQVRPDFIKIDMSLIRGVDTNPINRALLETMVSFADRIGCSIIAEGIETDTELSSLMDMGVHFGQGYFLARPANPKPYLDLALPVRPSKKKAALAEGRCSIPVGELAETAISVGPEVKINEVQRLLESAPPTPISGVVVAKDGKPQGLVMSHDLNRQLGTLYGVALYYERPISRLMDPKPLVFEEETPVELVAERAVNRDKYKVYDHILVTRGGELVGIVSVQKMLDTLARVQVEMAKGANPLTGLPGNVAIEQEIERRSGSGRPMSLMYVDLDNFKVYNDQYGFDAGDKMLLLLSKILNWSIRRHGGDDAYLGHVGGDDFVIMTSPERIEQVARGTVRCFERLVPLLYTMENRERGYLEGKGRNGTKARFPLTSVSLAIVDCQGKFDLHELGRRAAEMKTFAKAQPGNVWVRDRRTPLGLPKDQDEDIEPIFSPSVREEKASPEQGQG